jgi:hypothetical protein
MVTNIRVLLDPKLQDLALLGLAKKAGFRLWMRSMMVIKIE